MQYKMDDKKFYDKIAEVSLKCFKTLPKSGKPNSKEWTVLSCIVQEFNTEFTVVALGTGSKCIGESKMSTSGNIVNDSHAEIICRRSFMRYIYDQMSTKSKILEFNETKKKFCINSDIKFHFFTTHVPCGDATIFPVHNLDDCGEIVEEESEIPTKKVKLDNEDIFRTGAKCLDASRRMDSKLSSVHFHVTGVVRTKPGRGDATLSVSCSDKLAKWSHLGIQGALLSILLETPIYLSSFIIIGNTPFCEEAIQRAVYGRLGDEMRLKYPYKQNKMIFGQSSTKFEFVKTDDKQPCASSISWSLVIGKKLEVAVEGRRQGVTKKKQNTEAGRLKICKLELFKTFMDICEKRKIQLRSKCDISTLSYKSVKLINDDYQHFWNILKQCFKAWPVKNDNLLQFCVK